MTSDSDWKHHIIISPAFFRLFVVLFRTDSLDFIEFFYDEFKWNYWNKLQNFITDLWLESH